MLSLTLMLGSALAAEQTTTIGWPEAVTQLTEERTRAVTCASSLKAFGNKDEVGNGALAYGNAKADFDAVIAGLITVLAQDENPQSLPSLETRLQNGAKSLQDFCKSVAGLVPHDSGQKGILEDMVKAAVEPVITALSNGVAALYNNYRNDSALTRKTIQTQLEAAKWPDFSAAQ
jgi:hypothetical protein